MIPCCFLLEVEGNGSNKRGYIRRGRQFERIDHQHITEDSRIILSSPSNHTGQSRPNSDAPQDARQEARLQEVQSS
ncbi:hypothetical protein VTK73DRAFT_2258 [Phialemonium thermophilum]|uniref:Uncharacterized protein n=1 Tax=Phialemonium thermophilum TaxID=223376 RepID=A0ABR3X5V6_9PEZI